MNNIPGFDLLKENQVCVLLLKNGQFVNAGVIRVTNEAVVYYTGKGLREMWKPNMNDEERKRAEELKKKSEKDLLESKHIAITYFDEIERIMP